MPLKFEDLKLPEVAPLGTATVDMSEYLGEGSELTYNEPDTARIFAAREHAAQIGVNKPHFPAALCNFLGLLVVSHAAPVPDVETEAAVLKALRLFYGDLAERRVAFAYLTGKFYEAFPAFANFTEMKAESA